MKHALVTLIIVLLFVLIVVPLVYIAFGKLKNPVDLFAINKVATSVTKSNFISPNYIPDPNDGKPSTTNAFTEAQKQVDLCFKDMSLFDAGAFSYTETKGTKAQIVNNHTGTVWTVNDFTFTPAKDISKISNYVYFVSESPDPKCTQDPYLSTKIPELFNIYTDSNQFIEKIYDPSKYEDSNRFDLVEQGTSIISGHTYHWYLFDDKNRLTASKYAEKLYQAIFVTLDDKTNRVENFTIQGSSLIFDSTRDLLRNGQVLLSGVSYGARASTTSSTVSNVPSSGAAAAPSAPYSGPSAGSSVR